MRVVYWGTYDTGKPRNRILIKGLQENGVEIFECHQQVWEEIEDKSQIQSWKQKLFFISYWIKCYPMLIWKYLKAPEHDAVIVGYLGQLDVLVLWPFAKLRKKPIVWDAFLSLYDTIVDDRQIIGRKHALAYLLYIWEWLSCRAAAVVVLDTKAHGRLFMEKYNLKENKVQRVYVGAETNRFYPNLHRGMKSKKFTVLFYGQFIPLHGIPTIIEAARYLKHEDIEWILIGKGQEEIKIRRMLEEEPLPHLKWMSWIPYEELIGWIAKADVCLGIFGASRKAENVIPNKVFQILASGKALITRDSPAIRELIIRDRPDVRLVPAKDYFALSKVILDMKENIDFEKNRFFENILEEISEHNIGYQMVKILSNIEKL